MQRNWNKPDNCFSQSCSAKKMWFYSCQTKWQAKVVLIESGNNSAIDGFDEQAYQQIL
jgi:hypothetical protein